MKNILIVALIVLGVMGLTKNFYNYENCRFLYKNRNFIDFSICSLTLSEFELRHLIQNE
ncbi:MAG: hypothetical protein KatS3mg096_723 [Candidatus Parcubacteria bacterium]|nr:MAG: hypothetical protein KatS3mg096_723 [Candidatus Parcubacteria bacterium]